MNPLHSDLEALFNRVADGIASEVDEQQLGELLRSSPEARFAYRQFMALHSALHWDYVAAAAPESSGMTVTPARRASEGRETTGNGGLPSLARRVGVALAGALTLTLLIAWGWFAVTQTGSKPEAVALLHSADGVRWQAKPLAAGDELRAGQVVRIKEGVAELRFACGATVVLQGPASLQLDSARQVSLPDGAISAVVPPEAVGFTVVTPGLKVVDLGTRFGLKAKAGRGAELHVFQGRVQASLVDVEGKSIQTVTVNESEAVIAEPAAAALSTTAAELDAFAFDASLQRDVGGLIAPAINGGSSWEGWTLQGVSNQLGIYGSGSTTDVYKVYTTVFRFDNHTVSGSAVGSDGFAPGKFSGGAFANGNTILGIGVERVSGSPIAVPTVKFDLDNDSYKAASTAGGEDGQTDISQAHAGDFNTQFHYSKSWTPETLAVFDGHGNVDQLTGNRVGYDYAFRSFAVFNAESNQTTAYQLFFDLDAMQALYGPGNPGVGIGRFGSELTFAINGLGSNHAVVQNLSIVPTKASGR
ncbi:FecR domain-containing protein [Lignipirellula cremea]|uniref:FecR protein n=1 Tax=Lignipirellula cremea TaxID=2528010 RepID=A0A518DXN1_9BACT|nr:FecR domain-containing protein [Lignipirellula cremea]QDU96590.1 FecR protein [Lignipirellula cremea]